MQKLDCRKPVSPVPHRIAVIGAVVIFRSPSNAASVSLTNSRRRIVRALNRGLKMPSLPAGAKPRPFRALEGHSSYFPEDGPQLP